MSKNYINVSVSTGKPTRVSVSTPANQQNVDVTRDTSAYNAEIAKQWATSENLVLNEDYSSKYYANKSKESANTAKGYLESTREIHNSFASDASSYINELTELKETGKQEINEAVASGKDEINSTKTTILNDIEFVADGEKKEIEDLIDNGKEEIKESIGDVKVLTTLEIGDIGFTQMAIDETKGKRRILNGQVIIQEQYVQFTNIIKNSVALNPDLACTEAEWQTEVTMNTFGLCGKFVIDDEGGTIRLPKYPNYFIAGLANIAPVVGNGMTLGLTDGTHDYGLVASANHASSWRGLAPSSNYGQNVGVTATIDANYQNNVSSGVTTDPTKSGIEAQINEKQIVGTYFIQVATGAEAEDNIINEIELNNPFSLLDYKYSEYELNNLSWLRSNGQYNSKAIYPAVYDLLLKIYNGVETKAGVSVKLWTDADATEYDFRINTAEETFRLPIKVKLASGKAVVGNGMALGFTGGNGVNTGLNPIAADGKGYVAAFNSLYGQDVGYSTSFTQTGVTNGALGVTTDATKSGLELSDSDLYLYFYVGETVQNANLINAGRIEEKVASLIQDNSSLIAGYAMPSNRYIDLTLGASGTEYTAPANGYFTIGTIDSSATASQPYVCLKNNSNGMITMSGWANTANIAAVFLPAKKGDTVTVIYRSITNFSNEIFRFIYAEGDK
jgi:hypothetical protein